MASPEQSGDESEQALARAAAQVLEEAIPPASVVKLVVAALLRITPVGQLLLALVSLALFIFTADKLEDFARRLQILLEATLHTSTEIPGGRAYTGLEAFLLLNLNERQPDPSLPRSLAGIKNAATTVSAPSNFARFFHIVNPERTTLETISAHDQYLTYAPPNRSEAFFYFPGIVFPREAHTPDRLSADTISRALRSSEQAIADAQRVAALQSHLPDLDFETIDGHPVIQSYIIGQSGVLAIHKAGVQDQEAFYRKQFSPSRFFPERAYFWKTIQNPSPTPDKFDYVSEIYIDLAGNGFVRTFCTRLNSNVASDVICVDTELTQASIKRIENNLSIWHPQVRLIKCESGVNVLQPCDFEFNEAGNADIDLGSVDSKVQTIHAQADVFGQVVIYAPTKPGVLTFTVPLKPLSFGSGGNGLREQLLFGSLDIARVERESALLAAAAAASFATLMVCLFGLGRDYRLKVKQQREVLQSVASVMASAATPFAWTDHGNHFVRANDAFVRDFLKFTDFHALQTRSDGTKRTFVELVSASWQRKYLEIVTSSLRPGATTEAQEYDIEMRDATGQLWIATLRGERVPFPGFLWRGLPHRFGVVLRWVKVDRSSDPPA